MKRKMIMGFLVITLAVQGCMFNTIGAAEDERESVESSIQAREENVPVEVENVSIEWNNETGVDLELPISIKDKISVGNVETYLYSSFDNQSDSLDKLKEKAPHLLDAIKTEYSLETISELNWSEYYSNLNDYVDLVAPAEWYDQYYDEIKYAESFFDIYENEDQNNEIIEMLEEKKEADVTQSILTDEEFIYLLPYDSDFVEYFKNNEVITEILRENSFSGVLHDLNSDMVMYNTSIDNKVGVRATKNKDVYLSGTSIALANEYATRYAENYNKEYAYYKGKDCTNFVSQILRYTGIQMEYSGNDNSDEGWWYKGKNKHSKSWTVANTFAKYMGVGKKFSNHDEFSQYVQVGDFISSDTNDDGDWNHMGYVTQTKNIKDGTSYYDYKVAQHSSNYYKWVSEKENHWENNSGKYAIVRRTNIQKRAGLK